MNITIFNDLTTEDYLQQLELESEKYAGLYVEMDNKDERKFVKDKALLISNLLKRLDRARIDKSRDYKILVEEEASNIRERLEAANKPFTALIDEYKEKRARILAEKKAREDAEQLAIQIEKDHEDAITLDKIRTFEIEEAIRQQKERDEQIAKEAREQAERDRILAEERAEQAERDRILVEAQAKRDAIEAEKRAIAAAEQAERDRVEAEKQAQIRAEQAAEQAKQREIERQAQENAAAEEARRKLEANKKHVGAVRGQIKINIMEAAKIDEPTAKKIVLALCKMSQITINY